MQKLALSFMLFVMAASLAYGQNGVHVFASALDDSLQKLFPSDQPGIAVLVAEPGKPPIFGKGYGLADLNTREPITTHTIFNLGSVTKTFVAYGILRLQEMRKLSIEDPIGKYFPQFVNKSIANKIKIENLLSHTSGLPDSRPVERDSVFYLTANDSANFAPLYQTRELNFEPGSAFEYSNPAFNGLALVIEKQSGMKWQQFIKSQVFEPAGMRNSVITDGSFPGKGVAHGYIQLNNQWMEYDYGEYPTFCAAGNGGVWSSVEELKLYEEAIEKHVFLDSALINLSRTVYHPASWKSAMAPLLGFSWFIFSYKGLPAIGHTGDQAGFKADYILLGKRPVQIIILSNGNHTLAPVRSLIVDLLRKYGLI